MKKKFKKYIIIGVLIIIAYFVFGMVIKSCKKDFNYSIHYKSNVEKTIKEMVKPEALKDYKPKKKKN